MHGLEKGRGGWEDEEQKNNVIFHLWGLYGTIAVAPYVLLQKLCLLSLLVEVYDRGG